MAIAIRGVSQAKKALNVTERKKCMFLSPFYPKHHRTSSNSNQPSLADVSYLLAKRAIM